MSTINELYHHGIKGQRWGVRRFQNKDGSYTSAGKKRYGISEQIGKDLKKSYAETFKEAHGLSNSDSKKAADEYSKFVKKAVIVGASAAALGVGIYAYKYAGRNYLDNVIKAGTTIQTLSDSATRMDAGKAFYTAYTKGDKQKYVGMFGRDALGGAKYKIEAGVNSNIKVAGEHNAKKIYKDLMKNNPEFRQINERSKNQDYTRFNTYGLIGGSEQYQGQHRAQDIFYKELAKKGYGAVADVNDRRNSGFNTHAAIVFDKSKITSASSRATPTRLSNDEIARNQKIAAARMVAESLTNPKTIGYGAALGTSTALGVKSSQIAKKYKNPKKKKTGKR